MAKNHSQRTSLSKEPSDFGWDQVQGLINILSAKEGMQS